MEGEPMSNIPGAYNTNISYETSFAYIPNVGITKEYLREKRRMLRLVSAQELKSKFYVTNPYGKEALRWPKSTICLLKCKVKDFRGNQKIITESEQIGDVWKRLDNSKNKSAKEKKHAEIHMIEYLREQLKCQYEEIEEIVIKIIISYSPCIDCAKKIIEWKDFINDKNITVRVHIRFANFYRCHGTNNESREGLVMLLQAKISLEVFDRGFWDSFLYDVLKLRREREICHVIGEEEKLKKRTVRENIDKIWLMCLKKKSKFSLEETREEKRWLDQVFSNDDQSHFDYERIVESRANTYIEYLQNPSAHLSTSTIIPVTTGVNNMQFNAYNPGYPCQPNSFYQVTNVWTTQQW